LTRRSPKLGQKTHPIGFRLGISKDWQSRWFASKPEEYRALVKQDVEVRDIILSRYPDAGISRVEIERGNDVVITIHTARPGIVIGRGGQRVEELRKELEQKSARRARLNVQEIRQPELDAYLVGRNIAEQLERRVAFRRAIRQTVLRSMQAGALGIKVLISGRLGGADIARREKAMEGRVPLHTLRADIDYSIVEAATEFGRIGIKVWIYKGDIVPEPRQRPQEEPAPADIAPIEVTVTASEPEVAAPAPAETAAAPTVEVTNASAEES
jgi:small subunit ribosomal protein S3